MYSTDFTGIGRYVYELISNLVKLDRKHEYVVFMNAAEYKQFEPTSKRISKVLVHAKHYSLAEQLGFWRAISRQKLDVMHFTHFNSPILYRGKSVVTIHDLTLSFFPGKKMNSAFYRFAYNVVLRNSVRHANRVIAVSQNTKKDLMEELGTASSKVEVVYEGVNENFSPKFKAEDVENLKRKYGITRDYMLYTGVWRSHKNLVNLIRALKMLQGDEGFEPLLVITGEEDPYYPEVKRTVMELGLEHQVIYTGLVSEEELVSLYQGAHLYVFPSLYEGFGLPPLEAMRCGVPVVASKSSCIPEVCGEDNAVYFDPYDPEDLANALRKTWMDVPLRETLRANGLKHSRRFSWEKMAEETLKIYESL